MAQDNSIPLQAFQGQSPVDNFLSSYSASQQQAQGNEMYKRKLGALDQADEERKRQLVADALIAVPDGDAAAFEQVKQGLVSQGVIDPQTASQYDVSRLGQLKMMSQKWRDMKTFEMEQQAAGQRGRLTEAQIAATNRSNRPVAGGPGGLRSAPGMPGGKAPPEWAAKDAMWVKRGTEANNQFTPELTQALTTSTKDWVARGLGEFNSGLGNIAQTKQSRQASQIAKNFVAVVLRKDTGAAVTPKEFDFYQDIFIPQYGDDEGTLQLKETARNTFLQALGAGLSSYQALQSMNITPPEGLAPQDGEASAGDQTAADGEVTWTFDAQGNLVQAK